MPTEATVTLLAGGFGGARLAPSLVDVVGASHATIVTNPGDDTTWLGLEVWPDFDSVLFALAGVFDEERGWGIRGDSTDFSDRLGSSAWFTMGDRDLDLSRHRTRWLNDGASRSDVARRCCQLLGVPANLLTAAAEPHRTRVETREGWLPLQEYLVRRRAADAPLDVRLAPVARAAPPSVISSLAADVVVLGPSNPILSLLPILAIPSITSALLRARRVIAVSPVVTSVPPRLAAEISRYRVRDRMMAMAGISHSADGIADIFSGFVDGLVVDARDSTAAPIANRYGIPVLETNLLAREPHERRRLAREIVDFALTLEAGRHRSISSPTLRSLLSGITAHAGTKHGRGDQPFSSSNANCASG